MATKKEEYNKLHCPRWTKILKGIGLPGTTVFTCLSCGGSWTIDDDCVPVNYLEEGD